MYPGTPAGVLIEGYDDQVRSGTRTVSDEVVAANGAFDAFVIAGAELQRIGLPQVERDQLDQLGGEGEQVLGCVAAGAQLLVEGARQDADASGVIRRQRRHRRGILWRQIVRHGAPRWELSCGLSAMSLPILETGTEQPSPEENRQRTARAAARSGDVFVADRSGPYDFGGVVLPRRYRKKPGQ